MYRKFSADHIFTGYKLLQNHVLITDQQGVVVDVIASTEAGDGIERFDGILSPGFINCHCHLELSHMRGHIPKHTGLVDFVLKVVNERHYEEPEILSAIEKAEEEMLHTGIVAVGDICNNTLTIPQKLKGRLMYHNFMEASGFPPPVAETRFNRSADFYNEYSKRLPSNSIVPHAPYSVSPDMFRMINEFPGNDLLTMHNQEIAEENELFKKGTGDLLRMYAKMGIDVSFFKPSGKSSLQTVLPCFTNKQSLILVHNVCTSEEDIDFLKPQTSNPKPQTFFCLCPNANLYISNKLPDVMMFITKGVDIVLGTDSLASNDQLSILEEMKTIQENAAQVDLASLLQWATVNGARALQMNDVLGSFEKGKRPGIVLIENTSGLRLTEPSSSIRIL
ncbi:MAG TPA: amidohydrolase family protein [Ferruginibacter sp.]|nr:amidohydrolase family protein [Ferruginibacter sp.]